MCISPVRIRNPAGNGFLDVPCGKCLECANKNVNQFVFRILEQMKESKTAYFFTLTYNDLKLPVAMFEGDKYINTFRNDKSEVLNFSPSSARDVVDFSHISIVRRFWKPDVQKLIRKIRDEIRYLCKKNGLPNEKILMKYFVSSEYGDDTLRPHYHGIIFGFPGNLETFLKTLEKHWAYGFVSASILNEKRAYYTCKYSLKNKILRPKGLDPRSEKCWMICSKGIGAGFLTNEMREYMKPSYGAKPHLTVKRNGKVKLIPRYYRKKVFGKEDKFILAQSFSELFGIKEFDPYKERNRRELYDNQIKKIKKKSNQELL